MLLLAALMSAAYAAHAVRRWGARRLWRDALAAALLAGAYALWRPDVQVADPPAGGPPGFGGAWVASWALPAAVLAQAALAHLLSHRRVPVLVPALAAAAAGWAVLLSTWMES